jgi:hypothetical protein
MIRYTTLTIWRKPWIKAILSLIFKANIGTFMMLLYRFRIFEVIFMKKFKVKTHFTKVDRYRIYKDSLFEY